MLPQRFGTLALLVLAITLVQLTQAQTAPTQVFLPSVTQLDLFEISIISDVSPTVAVRSARSEARDLGRAVLGEVINNTSRPVYQVKITGTFYNSAGQAVASDDSLAFLPLTAPGQRNPFEVFVATIPPSATRVELRTSWRNTNTEEYRPLTLLSSEVRPGYIPEVFGELRNDNAGTLTNPEVAATFYDAAGNVIGVEVATPAVAPLPAGARTGYTVTANRSLRYATYTVQAQGVLAP